MSQFITIPLFPLNVVLFPGSLLPLKIFEQRYMEMTKICIRDNAAFGVCLIREGKEVGTPAIPCEIGCTARITHWDMPQTGLFHLQTQGETLFRIVEQSIDHLGLIHAQVELLPSSTPLALPTHHLPLRELLVEIINKLGAERFAQPHQFDDAAWVGYRLLEALPMRNPAKQHLLEQRDPLFTLDAISAFLEQHQVMP